MQRHNNKMFITVLLVFICVKCKTVSPDKKISNEYVINCDSMSKGAIYDSLFYPKGKYIVVMRHNRQSILQEIKGYALNSVYGHCFKFDFYGVLDNYKFIVDGSHFTYSLYYSIKDSLYKERGCPSVDYMRVLQGKTKDSLNFLFLFTKFPRQNIEVFYSINGVKYNKLKNEKSNLMPFLDEGELKMTLNTKRIFFRIETSNLIHKWPGLDNEKTFFDTTVIN
jgi:hypothetical protein